MRASLATFTSVVFAALAGKSFDRFDLALVKVAPHRDVAALGADDADDFRVIGEFVDTLNI